jgi:hypothetical protein
VYAGAGLEAAAEPVDGKVEGRVFERHFAVVVVRRGERGRLRDVGLLAGGEGRCRLVVDADLGARGHHRSERAAGAPDEEADRRAAAEGDLGAAVEEKRLGADPGGRRGLPRGLVADQPSQHFRHHRQARLRLGRRLRVEDAGADEDRFALPRRSRVGELETEDAAPRVVAADEGEHPRRRVLRFGQCFAVGDVPAVLSKFGRLVAERQVVQSQQLRRFVAG